MTTAKRPRTNTLQSMGPRRVRSPLQRRINDLAPWFHNLHLPDGTQTAPDHPLGDYPSFKWEQIAPHLPEDLGGWRALDIGCNAGFYTFQLAERGAEVLGIDVDPHYLRQAKWAAGIFGMKDRVRFERMQVYDLVRLDETFDLVLFMGVLYHLRYPMLALDIVAQKVRRLLVLQTLTMPGNGRLKTPEDLAINEREALLAKSWPKMAFIEHRLAGDPTNWWAPNAAAVEAMARSCGLRVVSEPGHEIFVCEPAAKDRRAAASPELASATGSRRRTARASRDGSRRRGG